MPISQIVTNSIANGAVGATQTTSANQFYSFKNRIINGAMQIDQRNAGASVNNALGGTGTYTLDRWAMFGSVASKFSIQQNAGAVTPPVGFRNYLGVTSLSAYSVPAGEIYEILQRIEGFNFADLMWGTANASPVAISFWVRSSLTGTFGGALNNEAQNRSYPFTYTISSANTWEQKTLTIAGDTTGTWVGATNGTGLQIVFGLGVGSTFSSTAGAWAAGTFVSATGAVSVVGTSGATFYITGVQLEKGSTATSFDYRPYGTELALCQRYYNTLAYASAIAVSTTQANTYAQFPTMRTGPTVGQTGVLNLQGDGAANTNQSSTGLGSVFVEVNSFVAFSVPNFSGLTASRPLIMAVPASNGNRFTLSAEL
jgi:hypothetical protein